MNNNGEKVVTTSKENEQQQEGRVILHYTEKLRRELNLRLMTEYGDYGQDSWNGFWIPERVLYVDSITVTGIHYPDEGYTMPVKRQQ